MKHENQSVFKIPQNTKEEVLTLLRENPDTYGKFLKLTDGLREELIAFCMGNRGLKITYDPFFKEILNPQYHRERLERFLSCVLGEKVIIKEVLPNESRRLASGASLLIMDMLVQLESGVLVNLEIQKVGYDFPGQRSACYSSDLVMREYSRLKSQTHGRFSYQAIGKVITIVVIENSSRAFHQADGGFVHHFKQSSDTSLELNLLQEYIFIALDVFRKITHNISTELEAWMSFLSSDDPVDILRVTEAYPYFKELYSEMIDFQRKPEELVNMFSEALEMLDRNTVQYMIEEREQEILKKDQVINGKNQEILKNEQVINGKNQEILKNEQVINGKNQEILKKDQEINCKDQEIDDLKKMIVQLKAEHPNQL